jgi:diaminohydroxyphosphoribosylaminopyrimidine deaminase/5-amino-6-(5-phosphoribosylamino)uracil reductase
VYTTHPAKLEGWVADGAEVIALGDTISLDAILADLGRRRFTNVLIEGGSGLLGSVLDAKAADEFHVFVAPKLIGGAAAPSPIGGAGAALVADALALDRVTFEPSGADVYVHGFAPRA